MTRLEEPTHLTFNALYRYLEICVESQKLSWKQENGVYRYI